MFSRRKVNSQPVTLALLTTPASSSFETQNLNNAFASPAIISVVDGCKTHKNKLMEMNAAHSLTSRTHVMAHTYSGALIAEAVLPHNQNVVKDVGVISVPYKGAVLICRVQKSQKHQLQSWTKKEENCTDETENKVSKGEDACTDTNDQHSGTMSISKEVMYIYSGRELLCSLPLMYKYNNNEHINLLSQGNANGKNAFIDDERERAARYPFLCKTNETQRNTLDAVFLVKHNAIGIAHLDLETLLPQSRCNYQHSSQARNVQKANVDVIVFGPYEGTDNIIENNNDNNNDDATHSEDNASIDQLSVSCYCNLYSNKNGALICVVLSDNTIALCGKVHKTESDESSAVGERSTTQDDMSESTMQEIYREVDTHGYSTIATEQEEEEQKCQEEECRTIKRSSKETWQIFARTKLPFWSEEELNYSSVQPSRVRRVCQVSNNTLCLVQENGSVHLVQFNLTAIKNDITHTTRNNSESQRLSQEREQLAEEQEEVQGQLHLQNKQKNIDTNSEAFQLEIITLANNIQLPKWSSPEYCFMFMEAGNSCKVRLCYSANTTNQTLFEQRYQQQQQEEEESQELHEHKDNDNYTKNTEHEDDDCIRKTICVTIEFARSLLTNNKVDKLYSITNNLDSNVHNVESIEELEEEEEQQKSGSTINMSSFDENKNNAQIATSNKLNYNLTYAMFALVENVYGFRVVSGLCELLTQATRAASALYITTLPANNVLMNNADEYKTKSLQSDTVQEFVGDNKNVYSDGTKENSVAEYFEQGKLDELHKLIMEKKLLECDLYECCQGCHDELNKIAVILRSARMNDANKLGVLEEKLQDVEHLVYALTCRELDSPCASELLLMTENDLSICTNTLANKLKSLGHSQAQRLLERIHQLRYAIQTFLFLYKCYRCCCSDNDQSDKIEGDKHEEAESKTINEKDGEEGDVWSAPLASVLFLESAHQDAQTRQDAMHEIIKSDHTFAEAAYLTHTYRDINHESVSASASNVMAQLTLWPKSSALCIDVILTGLQTSTLGIEEKSLCELLLSDVMTPQSSTSISTSCSPYTAFSKTAIMLLVLYCSNLILFHDNHNSDDAQNNKSNNNNTEEELEEEEELQEEHENSISSTNYLNYEKKKLKQSKIAELLKLQEMYLRCHHIANSEQMLSLAFVLCAIDHGVNPFATPFCYNSRVNVECNNHSKISDNYNSVLQHYKPLCITKVSFASMITQLQTESFSSSLLSAWFNNLLCVGAYSNAAQEIASILAFYKEPNTLPLYLAIRMLFVCTKMHNMELVMLLYSKLQHTVVEETAIRALVDVAIHHKSMQTLINLFSSHQRHRTALQIIEAELRNHANVELRERLLLEWYIALHRYDDARAVCNSIHPNDERDAEQLHVIDAQLQSLQTNVC